MRLSIGAVIFKCDGENVDLMGEACIQALRAFYRSEKIPGSCEPYSDWYNGSLKLGWDDVDW